MSNRQALKLQITVFALVAASFTNIYITQPVLPVLQVEFGIDSLTASLTVAATIFGIALANLPLGALVDRLPIRPILICGALVAASAGMLCAITRDIHWLIAGRFLQGLAIPAFTTCLAAYLARSLPIERLNPVMGSYVAATVLGGLGGRLLGGWIHPPLHWRYAFVSAALLLIAATVFALFNLPGEKRSTSQTQPRSSFLELIRRWELLRIFLAASGSFFIFSSVFNYLPFRLAQPPFGFGTATITLLYLTYVMGIFMGPMAGRLSNRFGNGNLLIAGTGVLAGSLALTLLPSVIAIVLGLLGLCAGFFTVHSAAVGSLNRRLSHSQGRANALYVLFYYLGGWAGILASGVAWRYGGWSLVIAVCSLALLPPLLTGLLQRREQSR